MIRHHVVSVLGLTLALGTACSKHDGRKPPGTADSRRALWKALDPVALKNCTLERVGSVNDGGYVMCGNLLDGVESVYSYGIADEDNWGCALASRFHVPVHQYDCFTPDRPTCSGGAFDFHAECVGDKADTIDGKPFDTIAAQIQHNGDAAKRLIVKIDVEGAEWDSLLATPDDVLARFDQLPMEMHGVGHPHALDVVEKLKKNFYLVSVHFNNYDCQGDRVAPFPSEAFQVLWVNKRLGVLDPGGAPLAPGSPPQAPDFPKHDDCQPTDLISRS